MGILTNAKDDLLPGCVEVLPLFGDGTSIAAEKVPKGCPQQDLEKHPYHPSLLSQGSCHNFIRKINCTSGTSRHVGRKSGKVVMR